MLSAFSFNEENGGYVTHRNKNIDGVVCWGRPELVSLCWTPKEEGGGRLALTEANVVKESLWSVFLLQQVLGGDGLKDILLRGLLHLTAYQ